MTARVLLIEDNEANLELMVYLLNSFGYSTITARDGQEGLAAALREAADLIICDLNIPKVDGYEVGRRLKAHPELRKTPLVAVTALAMVGDREKVLAAGFDGYLTKPIVPEKFVGLIESFLPEGRRSQRVAAPKAAAAAGQPAPHAAHRATVLVVDDSPVNHSLMHSLLEPFGYLVHAAENFSQGLALAHQNHVDLILCDIHIGKESGLDFCRIVKTDTELKEIPLVFLSSTPSHPMKSEAALALGAEKYISRPIEPQALLAEIEACLGKPERK